MVNILDRLLVACNIMDCKTTTIMGRDFAYIIPNIINIRLIVWAALKSIIQSHQAAINCKVQHVVTNVSDRSISITHLQPHIVTGAFAQDSSKPRRMIGHDTALIIAASVQTLLYPVIGPLTWCN